MCSSFPWLKVLSSEEHFLRSNLRFPDLQEARPQGATIATIGHGELTIAIIGGWGETDPVERWSLGGVLQDLKSQLLYDINYGVEVAIAAGCGASRPRLFGSQKTTQRKAHGSLRDRKPFLKGAQEA